MAGLCPMLYCCFMGIQEAESFRGGKYISIFHRRMNIGGIKKVSVNFGNYAYANFVNFLTAR